jgi:hypothetical protein
MTYFKKVSFLLGRRIGIMLAKCFDLNDSVKKISLHAQAVPYVQYSVEIVPITKLHTLSLCDPPVRTNNLLHDIEMIRIQPCLTKLKLANFKLTPKIIYSLIETMSKDYFKKINLSYYSISNEANEQLTNLAITMMTHLTSVADDGLIGQYLIDNLDLATLTKLWIRRAHCNMPDNIIHKVSKTNIVKICCDYLYVTEPYFDHIDNQNIDKLWTNILSDNYSLVSFYIGIDTRVRYVNTKPIKLINLTNRNKVSAKTRFIKVKPIVSHIDYYLKIKHLCIVDYINQGFYEEYVFLMNNMDTYVYQSNL